MKFFLCLITEMINGFETTTKSLIKAKNASSAQNKLNKIMKTWRGNGKDAYEDDHGYWFDGGGICVTGYVQKEVPKEHAVILEKYM